MKQYYEAYEERYRLIHETGNTWASSITTPIVKDVIGRYGIQKEMKLLEMGCGEGRDAVPLLKEGYDLTACDISKEAVFWCRTHNPEYRDHFLVLDCLYGECKETYDFIYAAALLHMLVKEEDRDAFYVFIHNHLKDNGIALICSMGDGTFESETDPSRAFDLVERNHTAGKVIVPQTSCKMISFQTMEKEIQRNHFSILESGITEALPEFSELMYAVIRK